MTLQEILIAAKRIDGVIHKTTTWRSHTFSQMCGNEIYLKSENAQRTGSFKVRGAYNKIARMVKSGNKPEAIIASSAGNHAQGVAYAAVSMGIKPVIVMPKTATKAKRDATKGYGAEVILEGKNFEEAFEAAKLIAEERKLTFIHAYNDEDIIAGQGTIALEILNDVPEADVIIVPVGGGGLLAGIAFAAKHINPDIKVIGVQAENANAAVQSFEAKERIWTEQAATIADGIAIKYPGKIALDLIFKYVDEMVTVSDEEIEETMFLLLERAKALVEPAGAVALAYALSGRMPYKKKKIVCVLSGGNVDIMLIHKILSEHCTTDACERVPSEKT